MRCGDPPPPDDRVISGAGMLMLRMSVRFPLSTRCERVRRALGRGFVRDEVIREVLGSHGRLSVDVDALGDREDLYEAGLTSHASVNVMLALEDAFDIEFPERMLRKGTFASVEAIRRAVDELLNVANP